MSQCSHVAHTPGGAPTFRDKPFAKQPMGCTEATTLCPPDPQGQTQNLLECDHLTTQDSPPSNPMPTGPARPGCQFSDSQPVYAQGVTPGCMDVGQRQQYDRPVQAVDLKPQVPPTQNPPDPVAYPQFSSVVAIEIIVIHQARLKWAGVWIVSLVVILYQYLMSPPTLVILGVKKGENGTYM